MVSRGRLRARMVSSLRERERGSQPIEFRTGQRPPPRGGERADPLARAGPPLAPAFVGGILAAEPRIEATRTDGHVTEETGLRHKAA